MRELFEDKVLLLRSSEDIAELFRDVRVLTIIHGLCRRIFLATRYHSLVKHLLEISFSRLEVVPEDTLLKYDVEYTLQKLALICELQGKIDSCTVHIPYLHPPENPLLPVINQKYRVGLAMYGWEEVSLTSDRIVRNLPLQKLHNTTFVFFPSAMHAKGSKPDCFEYVDVAAMASNYGEIAVFIDSLDVLIGFENDITHLAGAMGKALWLLESSDQIESRSCFTDSYQLVSVVYRSPEQEWEQLLRNIFLYQTIMPTELLFTPFNMNNVTLPCLSAAGFKPFPDHMIESTGQLQALMDVDVTEITSFSIETTTYCNLRCTYCPHSTEWAKTPAFMSDDLFYRTMNSLKEFMPDYAGQIIPSMYGEPLLDKRLEIFVNFTRQTFPLANIDLFTNGTFLSVDRYTTLRESGVTTFNVSIHSPEIPEKLQDTLAAIEDVYGDLDAVNLIHTFRSNKFNRGGLIEVDPPDRELCKRMLRCEAAYKNMSFDHKGNAIICCNDYRSQCTFGNIADESIQQIWDKSTYRAVRNSMLYGFLPLDICRICLHHQ